MLKVILCYIFLLIAAFVFYVAFVDFLSMILLITAILFPLFMFLSLLLVRNFTKVSFFCENSTASKDNNINFKVLLHNRFFMPLPKIVLYVSYTNAMNNEKACADFMMPLHFSKKQELCFTISSQFCGNIEAVLEKVVFFDIISMFRLKRNLNLRCNTYVLPNIYALENYINEETDICGEREIYSQTKPGDDSSEIFGLREYISGDRMSQIHWKLSSKQDSLIVKEYSKPLNSNVMLLFDFDMTDSQNGFFAADTLADILISLSNYMAECDCRHYIGLAQSSDNSFERFDIASTDDCVAVTKKLLSTPISFNSCALEGFFKTEFERHYSHIIYACSSIDEKKAAMLEEISASNKFSVIVVQNRPVNDILNLRTMFDSDIPFYAVECGNAEACLSELVI